MNEQTSMRAKAQNFAKAHTKFAFDAHLSAQKSSACVERVHRCHRFKRCPPISIEDEGIPCRWYFSFLIAAIPSISFSFAFFVVVAVAVVVVVSLREDVIVCSGLSFIHHRCHTKLSPNAHTRTHTSAHRAHTHTVGRRAYAIHTHIRTHAFCSKLNRNDVSQRVRCRVALPNECKRDEERSHRRSAAAAVESTECWK